MIRILLGLLLFAGILDAFIFGNGRIKENALGYGLICIASIAIIVYMAFQRRKSFRKPFK
jgi:hypothetical protein